MLNMLAAITAKDSRAQKRGQHMGRPPKLTAAQQAEARRRRAEGATLAELACSYGVGKSTISRLWRGPSPARFGIRCGQETAQPVKYPGGPAARKCKSTRAPRHVFTSPSARGFHEALGPLSRMGLCDKSRVPRASQTYYMLTGLGTHPTLAP